MNSNFYTLQKNIDHFTDLNIMIDKIPGVLMCYFSNGADGYINIDPDTFKIKRYSFTTVGFMDVNLYKLIRRELRKFNPELQAKYLDSKMVVNAAPKKKINKL